jgi:hypothetical protein
MSRTVLASSFLFSILAMVEAATSELCQMLVFIWYCVLMKVMATI